MFIRVKRRAHGERSYEYLQIVRSVRDGETVRQQVIANLGRREQLVASGDLDGLLRSLARFSEKLRVVEATRSSGLKAWSAKTWGPALVFGRLWERQGLPAALDELGAGRRFEFDLERLSFALALQRLCAPGSDLQGSGWVETIEAPGFDRIALQHMYRTCRFLSEVRQPLEQKLFWADRDLLSVPTLNGPRLTGFLTSFPPRGGGFLRRIPPLRGGFLRSIPPRGRGFSPGFPPDRVTPRSA